MTATYPLSIVAYKRGTQNDEIRPYHWQFHLATGDIRGVFHQLYGEPGNFWYEGAEKMILFETEGGKVTIGAVPADALDELERILEQIPVVLDKNVKWNCQSWCLDALEPLRAKGWIADGITETTIREALPETA
ncbi:hypothetical protein PUNSTDRAFT_133412 [Punctularia strigosozonata HHB-11173 SS5]|uniref:uncharacterized protein n=1 Tax=Punctularia strigosozonata (strain HHB-11173) TaxID=741275 RepID=UPI0004416DB3|nr:uncharacterized protein PUNSTDRAFT_133412 [Punctularia strigosozonata HHB-11173 SS5]EIN09634.1 hypothetical protein PUNSTDRAFT_133412 [Punctularia strigosozonata HHB-11173 SS5]